MTCGGLSLDRSNVQFGTRRSQTRASPFHSAHAAIDDCVHRLAHTRDSALGGVLSLTLFSAVRVRVLLLDKQLCHRWLWRYRSPPTLADLRPGRKHHRRPDVRVVRELPVRHREQSS